MTAGAATGRPIEALWRTLFRWDAAKIVPPVAVRNTIGFALAFVIGALADTPSTGVLAALGALNVSYSDSLDPYIARGRRMLLSSLLCGMAVTIGALSGHNNTSAVITAALGAFAAGMMVALGTRAGDLGVVILVTLIVFAARPLPPVAAFESGLVAFGGGVLQTLLSVATWPVKRRAPERRIIAELYAAIADIADPDRKPSASPPASRQISDAQQALASLARDHSIEAEKQIFLLNQAERIRLSLISLSELRPQIADEPGAHEIALALTEVLHAAAKAATDIGECALREKPIESVQAFEHAAARFRELAETSQAADNGLFRVARHQVDALAGQIRAAGSLSTKFVDQALNSLAAVHEPWYLKFPGDLARLRANLSVHSTVFRHALRLAVCLAAGDALGRAISIQRTYWIPMTIAIVLKPDFTATFSRGILRIAGTYAGLLLATVLFHLLHTGVATDIALMTVFLFLMRWIGPANYGIFVTALSAMVVLLIATTGVPPFDVITARAQNTSIGGALALLAYALWPTWEKTQVGPALAAMIDAYREYFDAVIRGYAGSRIVDLNSLRLAARIARSNAEASVDRTSGEPGVIPEQVAVLGAIMASSHAFAHAVMALESGLYHTRPVQMRAATREFAIEVGDTMSTISNWLQGRNNQPELLPDLRAAHTGILRSPVAPADRYTLLDRETDRITTAVNTLAEQARRWAGITGGVILPKPGGSILTNR